MASDFQDISKKIGDLCLHWAAFDQKIDRLFEIFLQIDATKVACIVASMDNFRARCETLKRLIINEPPSDKWADFLPAVLDFASAKMAPLRNRFVHDVWLKTDNGVMRVDKRAVAQKPQAGQRDEIRFNLHFPSDIGDIHTLTACVWNMSNIFDFIHHDLQKWRLGQLREPSEQLILHCNNYFELLHHQWPKQARYLLPQSLQEKTRADVAVQNSYIVPR